MTQQAAAYPVQTLTAAYGLFECGGFRPGQAVLVHSAAGGVGLQALQILSKSGAAVLGLVGSDSKVAMLQEMYGSPATAQQQQQQQSDPQQQQQQQQQQRPYFEFAARQGDDAAARQQLSSFLSRAGCSGFDVILDSLGPGECWPFTVIKSITGACAVHSVCHTLCCGSVKALSASTLCWSLHTTLMSIPLVCPSLL
jgi:NADPH:quinone reductase-like Zn-dependent oxidoreductase